MIPQKSASRTPIVSTKSDGLVSALRAWWQQESDDWDAAVEGAAPKSGTDVWDDMPTIDSKAVARSSPVFEEHLGVKLDVAQIREGGYSGIEDMITDLVPKMRQLAGTAGRNANPGQVK